MIYEIKRGSTTVAAVRANGVQERALSIGGVVDVVNMSFELNYFVDFIPGDTVEVYGVTYFLPKPAVFTEHSTIRYSYQLHFKALFHLLDRVQCFNYNEVNVLDVPEFDLVANADDIIDLILANANREQSGWVKGTIDATEAKLMQFSGDSCLKALSRVSEEFDIELWIDGKTLNLTHKGVVSGIELAYGQDNGLYEITRNNIDETSVITRLYALGGTKNLPANYRNFSKRLRMPVATGAYIETPQTDPDKIVERTEYFDDIFPHRDGAVSAVDAGNHLVFTDASMDFDVNNQLLPDPVKAKVIFKSGLLASYEFEINNYNHATKTFTLNVNKDEKAFEVPSATLKPAIGDIYTLVDLEMPQSYITAGENELKSKAEAHKAKNEVSRVIYAVRTDKFKFQRDGIIIGLGNTVHLNDIPTGINVTPRILSFQRDINDPFMYPALDVSESVLVSTAISQHSKQEKIQRALIANRLFDVNRARNNWQNSQELLNLVFDADGHFFSEKIAPLSIETTMLAVGARSQQFQLNGVVFQPNFGADPARFVSSAGTLDHFTIDPASIKTWNIAASDYTGLAPTAFYIYAKCEKASSGGVVLLSTAQINVDEDTAYYHFLIGILHSPI